MSVQSSTSAVFGRSPEWLDREQVRSFQVHLVAGDIMAGFRPDGLRPSARSRPDARAGGSVDADHVNPRRAQVARGTGGRRGSALPGGGAEPQGPCHGTTAYAAGLRASDAAGIKVADIYSSRVVVRLDQGTGERVALLRRDCGLGGAQGVSPST